MPNYRRPRISGSAIFFTVNLSRRGSNLLVRDVERLRSAFRAEMQANPFWIHAIVVLPDHLHAVWTLPDDDTDYSSRWGRIKARFSEGVRKRDRRESHLRRGERGIWQRRFWEHHIRGAQGYRRCVEYCWINPVKHGYVQRAADWPFSSIHRDICAGRVEPEWSVRIPDGEFGTA